MALIFNATKSCRTVLYLQVLRMLASTHKAQEMHYISTKLIRVEYSRLKRMAQESCMTDVMHLPISIILIRIRMKNTCIGESHGFL